MPADSQMEPGSGKTGGKTGGTAGERAAQGAGALRSAQERAPDGLRARNRREQRARIVESAKALFSEHGVDAVTVADVARLAGVARATVFNYFPSKSHLVDAITSEVVAYYVGMLDNALDRAAHPTPELVRTLFVEMGQGIEHFHSFYRGVFREMTRLQVGLERGSELASVRGQALERLTKLLARGLERGDLASSVPASSLAAAFDSLVIGTINHWLFEEATGSLRDRMAEAAEIFLGGVAAVEVRSGSAPPDLMPDIPAPQGGIAADEPGAIAADGPGAIAPDGKEESP